MKEALFNQKFDVIAEGDHITINIVAATILPGELAPGKIRIADKKEHPQNIIEIDVSEADFTTNDKEQVLFTADGIDFVLTPSIF